MLIKKIIKKPIINIINIYYRNKNKIKWINDKRMLQSNYKEKLKEVKSYCNTEKVLIIAPHADDELIGCYQFLNKNKRKSKIFYCGFTGNNNDVKNKEIRLSEFKEFCKIEQIKYHIVSNDVKFELLEVIKGFKPDIILVPTCIDWHWQHRLCNYICLEVLENLKLSPNICWYQISVPIPDKFLNSIISLNKTEQNNKWKMFNYIYESQKHMPIFRYKIAERITGFKVNKFAAEAFAIQNFEEWKLIIRYIEQEIDVNRLENLERDINDLKKIWFEVIQICDKLNNDKNTLGEKL